MPPAHVLIPPQPPLAPGRTLPASGQNSGEAEGDVMVGEARLLMPPVRRLTSQAEAGPTPAPDQGGRAPVLGVVEPLPDVTMHVVDPQTVRSIRAHFRRPREIEPLRGITLRMIAIEVGLLGGKVVGRIL